MKYTYSFEKLAVWQENRVFTRKLYQLTACFPKEEFFGITSQLRRATISISCNLSEGSCRLSPKEQFRFYEIAFGSGAEVVNLLIISHDLEYISEADYLSLRTEMENITLQISKLIKQRSSAINPINP